MNLFWSFLAKIIKIKNSPGQQKQVGLTVVNFKNQKTLLRARVLRIKDIY